MPFWKQATQSELVATNSRRIWLAANGSSEARASAREDAISVRSYLMPREPCQLRSSASTGSIGALIKPKSCVTGCHFSISDGISNQPQMLLTVIVSRCAVAKLPKHVPNSAGVYWSLDASDADGLRRRGLESPAPVAMARPSLQDRHDEHLAVQRWTSSAMFRAFVI